MIKVTHQLKILPEYFKAVLSGEKTFEYRKNDRGYDIGHYIELDEWSEKTGYTGRRIKAKITYIMKGFIIPEGYCIFSFKRMEHKCTEKYNTLCDECLNTDDCTEYDNIKREYETETT